jgi:hypothetical protein
VSASRIRSRSGSAASATIFDTDDRTSGKTAASAGSRHLHFSVTRRVATGYGLPGKGRVQSPFYGPDIFRTAGLNLQLRFLLREYVEVL